MHGGFSRADLNFPFLAIYFWQRRAFSELQSWRADLLLFKSDFIFARELRFLFLALPDFGGLIFLAKRLRFSPSGWPILA